MICVFLFLCLIRPQYAALVSLPAPENLSMNSKNFHHLLRWDPGPGTPAEGTQYEVFGSVNRNKWKPLGKTPTTSLKVKLNTNKKYNLSVQASYNQSSSKMSRSVTFEAFSDTRIGPAEVFLSGCGNCLTVNISLPEPDPSSKVSDLYRLYDPSFKVLWKKRGDPQNVLETKNRSFMLPNLEKGVEYCIQVEPDIRVNKNTEPSTWSCAFTSILEPSKVPVFVGVAAALLILVTGVIIVVMFSLYYSGFLCKLKANLPRALLMALGGGYTLTPEMPILEHVSISSEKSSRIHIHPTPQPAARGEEGEEEEEEEVEEVEEENKEYMDRGAELHNTDGSGPNSASGDSGVSTANRESEGSVTQGGLHQEEEEEEEEAEEAVSVRPEGGQTGLQGHVTKEEGVEKEGENEEEETEEIEEEEEEVCDSSGNVNLFSVKLSTLAASEEEEEEEEEIEEEEEEVVKEEDSRHLLTHLLDHTHTNSAVTHLTETHTRSSLEEEEEEEEDDEDDDDDDDDEEGFSGYMRHS
ncbi:interleukin-10 receptor subunit beta-like [Notolabrus celidotus]|uniref:interleukin-10 receptor subunit beta-like n=1 Tax=Notolabrus celidotus TaxID=1203425 RepID=UPI0014907299|nr:interleukin-10 receptor subunit beta-like [Notolabrus celidotus]